MELVMDIKTLIEQLKSNDGPIGNLQDEAADALETLRRQLEEKEAENARVWVASKNLTVKLAAANAEIERLKGERDTAWDDGHIAGREKSPTFKENQELREQLAASQEEWEQCSGLLDDALRSIGTLEDQLASANAKIDRLKRQLATVVNNPYDPAYWLHSSNQLLGES